MAELERLETWLNPLLTRLTAQERAKLMRDIARDILRRRNQQRIRRQQAPDGTPFEPRKPQQRKKKGAIKRGAMFKKLRLARFMKTTTTPDSAAVQFVGRVGRIAAVHHRGLRDRINSGTFYDYPQRELLGFGAGDIDLLGNYVIERLGNRL